MTSQAFRIQICGAIEQLNPMVLWDMLYLKMSRFLSLLYKQEIFYYFMWMSPWRSGSMQVSHTEGPWFQSRSSSFLNFFFSSEISFFQLFISKFQYRTFFTWIWKRKQEICVEEKYYKRKKMNLIGIGTRDLRHVRPACYHYATVTFT